MLSKLTTFPLKIIAITVAAVLVVGLAVRGLYLYHDWQKNYYTIGVFYNSANLPPEDMAVIKLLTGKKTEEINQQGGIAGRPLRLLFLDDESSRETVLKVVNETIYDPNLIAYVGCWSSTRVQAVAKLVGKEKVPFIGGYSVPEIAEAYPNMFSYETGVDQMAFVTHQLLKTKAKKLALIGNTHDVYSIALFKELQKLQDQDPAYERIMLRWYENEHEFTPEELRELTDSLAQFADFLLLSTNPEHTNVLLKSLGGRQLRIPVFSAYSDIPEIDTNIPGFREMDIYDVSVFGIPSALNLRCQELEATYKDQLKESHRLQFQLGLGGLYADAIGLIKAASEDPYTNPELPIRQRINQGLAAYINGQKVYRGWFSDWHFTPGRFLVSEVLLGWKPPNLERPLLAPLQFLNSDSGLQPSPVFYTNIDLIGLDQVNDEKGTFNASFFLEINAEDSISLNQLDFVNAVRNEVDHEPLLTIKMLRAGKDQTTENLYNYLYRITGHFHFSPELEKFPFDEQRFSIILQNNSAFRPFLIQPPPEHQTNGSFSSPGWNFKDHFVGFDQDLIYSANSIIREPHHVPLYKFSYSYVLKRDKVDFFLKVLTPLLVLLIIAYLSAYIPIREFVSVAAIQVTSLLSAIALYFSAYKPEMSAATISDKIFIFTYIMITTITGTSVLQYWLYRRRRSKRKLSTVVSLYERVLFPVIVIGFTIWLIY